jgi:multimeric flavodoxin WrbA
MSKIIGFNGSPRKDGNTAVLVKTVLNELASRGVDTEFVQLGGQAIHGCTACMKCRENANSRCVIEDDPVNECIEKIINADGIVIGSPTYFADLTPETKAFIDRVGFVSRGSGNFLDKKLGAAVVAVRRAGAMHVFDSINHFFLINNMIVPGASYWNIGIGKQKGDVEKDSEGIETMKSLGQNIAWLLEKI